MCDRLCETGHSMYHLDFMSLSAQASVPSLNAKQLLTENAMTRLLPCVSCRCNASRAERKQWMDIAGCPATTLCVAFCYSRELCLQRGEHRLNHPTLRPGRMTNAMDQMEKDLQSPSLQVSPSPFLFVPVTKHEAFYASCLPPRDHLNG